MSAPRRAARSALLAALLAMLTLVPLTLVTAGSAQAAAYRFWGYFQWQSGTWQFAQTGPDQATPADGGVEGWRFAVGDEGSTRLPRAAGDFDAICGSTKVKDGTKRVAVVVDYGVKADDDQAGDTTPPARGECAQVPTAATGAQVLAAVDPVRVEGGLVCAIDSYPSAGCGGAVDGAAPTGSEAPVTLALPSVSSSATPAATASDSNNNDGARTLWLVGGIAVVVVAGAGAFLQLRRSRKA